MTLPHVEFLQEGRQEVVHGLGLGQRHGLEGPLQEGPDLLLWPAEEPPEGRGHDFRPVGVAEVVLLDESVNLRHQVVLDGDAGVSSYHKAPRWLTEMTSVAEAFLLSSRKPYGSGNIPATVAQAASATVPSSVPLLAPATSNGSTLKADVRSKTPRGSPANAPRPNGASGGVSLSYAECPGCARNFATNAAGLIPAHRAGKYPFPRHGQPTAPACPGSLLIVLEA